MGCDIHAHIEYYENTPACVSGAFTFALDIDFGRCYQLFSLMAGVRGMDAPVVPPRGVPRTPHPEYSFGVASLYYNLVIEDEEYEKFKSIKSASSSLCFELTIPRLLARSDAERVNSAYGTPYTDQTKTMMQDPNWHTPSWLYTHELIEIRHQYLIAALDFNDSIVGKKRKDIKTLLKNQSANDLMAHHFGELEYTTLNATIATMLILERKTNFTSRLVFWFDS